MMTEVRSTVTLEQNSEVGDPEVCTAALDETAASPSLPEKSPTKESARAAAWKRRSELRHRSAQRSSQPMETLLCCPTVSGSDTETSNAEKAEDQAKKSYREIIQEEREKSLNCSLEEKRKLYACASEFHTLSDVKTWPVYCEYNRQDVEAFALRDMLDRRNKKKEEVTVDFAVDDELNSKVSIWSGRITTLEIDCIVNAANNSLLGGGGVDGAIHSAAGSRLYNECKTLNGCDTGEEKDTAGYDLPAKYVIHTVGPRGEQPKMLHSCYYNCLQKMLKLQQKTIAFPCISTGSYAYPNEKAVHVVLRTVRDWLEDLKKRNELDQVERVIFCLFQHVDLECYSVWMPKYFPLHADVKMKSSEKTGSEQAAVADIEQKTPVPKASENTAVSDAVPSSQENGQGDGPQRETEPEAVGWKEIAAQDSGETGFQHEDDDGQKLRDSGQQVALQLKDVEQPILKTQEVEEEKFDSQKELQNLPESEESVTANTTAQDDDRRTDFSDQQFSEQKVVEQDAAERGALTEQQDISGSHEIKTEKSREQGEDDAEVRKKANEDIKPELTDEQHTPSRL